MSAIIGQISSQQGESAPLPGPTTGRFQRLLILAGGAVIIVAGLLAYHNSFSGPFIFDGKTSISENSHIRRLWPIWHVFRAQPGATVSGRPVLSLSLALNYRISGLNVWSYHAVNLAVHILAALTLFGIVRRTLLCEKLRARFGKASFSLALICALIWLLHPLQTGSVTYIVQRAESLMGLFYLLSLYCAIRGFSSAKSRLWYIAAILVCALGMGTKEVVATAPVIVLLYDRVFVSRSFKEIFARRWGLYAGLAATWIIFVGIALSAPRGSTVGFGFSGLGWLEYSMTQCKVIVSTYLKLSFWPSPLILDYGWPIVERFGDVVPYALVLAALLIGTVLALRYYPAWGFLGVWFFVILGPSSSIVPIFTEVAAEHRMYLPLAAIVVAVVLGGYVILTRLAISDKQRASFGQALGYVLAGGVVVIFAVLTIERNYDYASELLIWDATVSDCPDNHRALNNRGLVYSAEGNYPLAIRDFDQAIVLNPVYVRAYNNRAIAYGSSGELDLAIRDLNKIIELNPNHAKAYNNRGVTYANKGEFDQAIRDFEKAIQLAQASGDQKFVESIQRTLELYKAKRPYPQAK